MTTLNKQTFLVLSIHEIHAERIFAGVKLFELRKVLPRFDVHKVFLYQTGGKGLVGAFDVEEILRDTPENLWEKVGERATTESRFFDYFQNRSEACAIRLSNPVKFLTNIDKDFLKKHESKFTAPQGYLIVSPETSLHKLLSATYKKEVKKKSTFKDCPDIIQTSSVA